MKSRWENAVGIERKVVEPSEEVFVTLERAKQIHSQHRKDKSKLYSLDAPEVECIGKGKAHKRYEFGCKVSLSERAEAIG